MLASRVHFPFKYSVDLCCDKLCYFYCFFFRSGSNLDFFGHIIKMANKLQMKKCLTSISGYDEIFLPIVFNSFYHWASIIRLSLAFCILINSSKTTGPIWTKLWWSPFRNVSDNPARQPRWLPLLKIEHLAKNHLKIIFSETAGPIWTNYGGMVFFENCVWRPRPPTKMAAITKNRKFGKK